MAVLTRRNFLAAGGVAAVGAAAFSGNRYVFGAPGNPATGDTVVVVFLRGGADGLHMAGPVGRGDYQDLRGRIAPEANQPLNQASTTPGASINIDGLFLHPEMSALYDGLWAEGKMALIPGCGVDADNFGFSGNPPLRSHFDMQRYNEKGTGSNASNTGWLARFVEAQGQAGAIGSIQKDGGDSLLLNGTEVVSISDLESLTVGGGLSGFRNPGQARTVIEQMYSGSDDSISLYGQRALQSAANLENLDPGVLRPNYPNGGLGNSFAEVATILGAGVGVQAVEINYGGWDTHRNIVGEWSGGLMSELCESIQQLAVDTNGLEEVTVVVTTEFGRTMRVNGDAGTDHGSGRTDIVLGNGIVGGVYGDYPDSLADVGRDFPVLNDYRQVLSEVISVRGDVPNAEAVFPGYNPPNLLGFATA